MKITAKKTAITALKVVLSAAVIYVSGYAAVIGALALAMAGINDIISFAGIFVLLGLLLPMIWVKRRGRAAICWAFFAAAFAIAVMINLGIIKHEKSLTIDTAPNIDVEEYLPFDDNSKIVNIKSKVLQFDENPPRIDGAAALFPVYSAFVNATYPETTELYGGVFEYNNTPEGYRALAEKRTDVFIGVYPSEKQRKYAEECNTTFEYTPIGSEAFVFFVHKDNPIDSLTVGEIQGIYSGKITNWSELGGKNEEIVAFQRNEGSGSQTMLKKFMGDKQPAEAPKEQIDDMMVGIIERVSDYKSKSNSMGFSFRYYVEGIIKNPDIKMIAVDGVEPTAENIKKGIYPIITQFYAVTYAENENPNTERLIEWILSDEGQSIIEETGYVGITK